MQQASVCYVAPTASATAVNSRTPITDGTNATTATVVTAAIAVVAYSCTPTAAPDVTSTAVAAACASAATIVAAPSTAATAPLSFSAAAVAIFSATASRAPAKVISFPPHPAFLHPHYRGCHASGNLAEHQQLCHTVAQQ